MIHRAYGPNYPIKGKCYNEDGVEYFDGCIEIVKGGVGYPTVINPSQYGTLVYKVDIRYFSFDEERRLLGEKEDLSIKSFHQISE